MACDAQFYAVLFAFKKTINFKTNTEAFTLQVLKIVKILIILMFVEKVEKQSAPFSKPTQGNTSKWQQMLCLRACWKGPFSAVSAEKGRYFARKIKIILHKSTRSACWCISNSKIVFIFD